MNTVITFVWFGTALMFIRLVSITAPFVRAEPTNDPSYDVIQDAGRYFVTIMLCLVVLVVIIVSLETGMFTDVYGKNPRSDGLTAEESVVHQRLLAFIALGVSSFASLAVPWLIAFLFPARSEQVRVRATGHVWEGRRLVILLTQLAGLLSSLVELLIIYLRR